MDLEEIAIAYPDNEEIVQVYRDWGDTVYLQELFAVLDRYEPSWNKERELGSWAAEFILDVLEEENGEIIVTNLLSRSFPIIRYKLGDFVRLASSDFKCSCGRAHPVILDVLGRVGKNVLGKKSIYPSLTFYYVFKN